MRDNSFRKFLLVTTERENSGGGLSRACGSFSNILESLHIERDIVITSACSCEIINGGYDPLLGERLKDSITLKTIVEESKKSKYERVVALGGGKNAFMAMQIAKSLDLPMTIYFMGSDINLSINAGMEYQWNREAMKYAENFVVYSREMFQNVLSLGVHPEKYGAIIPNYYEFTPNIQASPLHAIPRLCIGAYYLNEKKAIANFLKCLYLVRKNYGAICELFLVGAIDDDIRKKYENLVAQYGLQNCVHFCGACVRDEFLRLLEEMDIYVQSSFFEGCSYAVTEAIDKNKYLLLSKTGYFFDILGEQFPNIFFSSHNPDKMAEKLSQYLANIGMWDNREEIRTLFGKYMNKEAVCLQWTQIFTNRIENIQFAQPSFTAVLFHDVNNAYSGVDYPIDAFARLLELAALKGFRLCSMREYLVAKDKSHLVVCTFDDAYENVYLRALPLMEKYKFTATVFVCPDLLGGDNSWDRRSAIIRRHMSWSMLEKLFERGWEIGSHGMGHFSLLRLSQTELEQTMSLSGAMLEKFNPVSCFCYPYGYFNNYIMNMAKKYYQYSFSVTDGGVDLEKNKFNLTRITPEELKIFLQRQ